MKIILHPLVVFLLLSLPTLSEAQVFAMDNSPIRTCSGFFLDSGGNFNPYGPNEILETQLCPDNTTGTHSILVFYSIEMGAGDVLCFYDGPDATAPLIACASDFAPGESFIIRASALNPTGCLTISFQSDDQEQAVGWYAEIDCSKPCQDVKASISAAFPPINPPLTGTIDLCLNESLSLEAAGEYPQNDALYNQSDATSLFQWNMGDGTVLTGKSVNYAYDQPGGYVIELTVIDANGCVNTNFISQRVRVAPKPEFGISPLIADTLCHKSSLTLTGGIDLNGVFDVFASPQSTSFQVSGVKADSLPIPDGDGQFFTSQITFSDFGPGQLLTDINDLLGICVLAEHSFMRDLEIKLICPNGQEVTLEEFLSRVGNEAIIGIPDHTDEGQVPPKQGTGFEYCWNQSAANGSLRDYADNNIGAVGTIPPGNYESENDLNALIGCPLNGTWTLLVEDNWPGDNGWIFSWSLIFDERIFPSIEEFTAEITNFEWGQHPNISLWSDDRIDIILDNTGESAYRFFVTDEYGCINDTTVVIYSQHELHPDCHECQGTLIKNIQGDTTVCRGDSLVLSVDIQGDSRREITFDGYAEKEFFYPDHSPLSPLTDQIIIEDFPVNTITDYTNQIISVCIDIEHDHVGDLNVELIMPSGFGFPLVSREGDDGVNFENTCFSINATQTINGSTAPFTGEFQPIGDWFSFQNQPINGIWTLQVSDARGSTTSGKLNNWSISFGHDKEFVYNWTNSGVPPCTDCPSIKVPVDDFRIVGVTVRDEFDCSYAETFNLGVTSALDSPEPMCEEIDQSTMRIFWAPIAGADGYRIKVNADPWIDTGTTPQHVVSGLTSGATLLVEVVAYIPGCTSDSGITNCLFSPCLIVTNLTQLREIDCNGNNTGQIAVNYTGEVDPIEVYWNGSLSASDTLDQLDSGWHYVEIIDGSGCIVRDSIFLEEPDELLATFSLDSLSCFDDKNALLTAIVAGGKGPYSFLLDDDFAQTDSIAGGLSSGNYSWQIMDVNECAVTLDVFIPNPTPIALNLSSSPARCTGSADGSALVEVSGGSAPYTYLWNDENDSTQDEVFNLEAGWYRVTVTDNKLCEVVDSVQVLGQTAMQIDSFSVKNVSCFGAGDGEVTVHVSGGAGNLEYNWNDPFAQFGKTARFLSGGWFTVFIEDENDCFLSDSVFIDEPTEIIVLIEKTDIACFGDADGMAEAFVSGGEAPYTYAWNDPSSQTDSIAINLDPGDYILTIIDANDCETQAMTNIAEPSLPLVVIPLQTDTACAGSPLNEVTLQITGGVGNHFNEWSNGQVGLIASGLTAGWIGFEAFDDAGCIVADSFLVNAFDTIAANFLVEAPKCPENEDGSIVINFISGGGGMNVLDNYDIEWINPPGLSGTTLVDLPAGQYEVEIRDKIASCSNRFTIDLKEPDPLEILFEKLDVSCNGQNNGSIEITGLSNDANISSILWDAAANNQTTPIIDSLIAGNYTVLVKDENDCEVEKTFNIQESDMLEIDVEVQAIPCNIPDGGSIEITISGGQAPYAINWSNGSNDSLIENLTLGNYSVIVRDVAGCEGLADIEVPLENNLTGELSITQTSCKGDDAVVSVLAAGSVSPYSYRLNGQDFSDENIWRELSPGSYTVSIRDSEGCIWTSEEIVILEPIPSSIELGEDIELVLGDSIQLSPEFIGNISGGFIEWSSQLPLDFSCVDCPDPWVKPEESTRVFLEFIDANGCVSEDQIFIRVVNPRFIAVPTGFSPNGDSNNDVLIVHGEEGIKIASFGIYNRRGEELYLVEDFDSNDASFGWDGSYKSQFCPSGVYVWKVLAEIKPGSFELFSGNVTLIR